MFFTLHVYGPSNVFCETRQCPLCRRQEYQKKAVEDGAVASQIIAATKFQALWRGHTARKAFFHMLLERDPQMRRTYQYGIVRALSDRYLAAAETNARNLDRFFEQLDVARTRARLTGMTPDDWKEVRARALARGIESCPICLQGLEPLPPLRQQTASNIQQQQEAGGGAIILSCTHCFHAACLRSFEQFQFLKHDPGERAGPMCCPVCREEYCCQTLSVM
eukprot:TRINITY_DN19943_c0_g1_i1.p1 TRINITY_DN19943_c0_g1~~TRINITY_DN19943_c0_g1_i1.p1  ORF type:complete len:221 (+),score=13.94 TRINITY_DN19943_c0_g1_i1:107-769(+)